MALPPEGVVLTEEALAWVRDEGLLIEGETCGFQTYSGSNRNYEPPEWCENDVVPGSDFCSVHAEDDEPEPDDEWDDFGSFDECYEYDDSDNTKDCD